MLRYVEYIYILTLVTRLFGVAYEPSGHMWNWCYKNLSPNWVAMNQGSYHVKLVRHQPCQHGYPRQPSQGDDVRFSGGLCGTSWDAQRWSAGCHGMVPATAREPNNFAHMYYMLWAYMILNVYMVYLDLWWSIRYLNLLYVLNMYTCIHTYIYMQALWHPFVPGQTHKGFQVTPLQDKIPLDACQKELRGQ